MKEGHVRRVFLHVGTPKSGTTYLQERIAANRDLIAEQGLFYPPTNNGNHFYPALDVIQRPWAGELEKSVGQWDALASAARAARGDVLISHEILAAARPEQVRRVMDSLSDFEIHIVVTARDLARQIPAEWQEQIKHRGTASFARVMSLIKKARRRNSKLWFWRVQALPDVLTRWGSGLEPARIHLVTVPPSGAPRDLLWRRFCSVVGIDPDREYVADAALNASLGAAETNVVRRLNLRLAELGVERSAYVELVRELVVRQVLAQREDARPARLPAAARPFVAKVTAQWLEWLEGSGIDVVGELADLEPVYDDRPVPNPDKPPMAHVADAALDALAQVIAHAERSGVVPAPERPLAKIGRRMRRT